MKSQASLLITRANQLVTPIDAGTPAAGRRQSELCIIEDGALAIQGDRIAAVGRTSEVLRSFRGPVLDARGCTVTPGLVDAHTHLVFAGTREHEFEMRIRGADYMQIAKAGGGILSTVDAVRRASPAELRALAAERLHRMRRHGTTTVEVKTGYGLSLRDELKSLHVIRSLGGGVVPTFLGAHEVPREYRRRRRAYVRAVIGMLEKVAPLAKFCDVFCEEGVFSVDEARQILLAAHRYGMLPKLHAEEFVRSGGARLAVEIGAVSADHLTAVNDQDIRALANSKTIAVLLPGTSFFLGKGRYAPGRRMIDAGLAVALGSDFNPGSCMSYNLALMMTIACTQMRLTPAEALVAATLNSAYAVGLGREVGSLERGKRADVVIWDAPDYRFIVYHFGVNLVRDVIIGGRRLR